MASGHGFNGIITHKHSWSSDRAQSKHTYILIPHKRQLYQITNSSGPSLTSLSFTSLHYYKYITNIYTKLKTIYQNEFKCQKEATRSGEGNTIIIHVFYWAPKMVLTEVN